MPCVFEAKTSFYVERSRARFARIQQKRAAAWNPANLHADRTQGIVRGKRIRLHGSDRQTRAQGGLKPALRVTTSRLPNSRRAGSSPPYELACQYAPMKSFLPISTPLWRSRSYAVVTWKKNCGSPYDSR